MLEDRVSKLNYGKMTKRTKESETFRPDEKNADPKALICLKCNLPGNSCNRNVCKRYSEEIKSLKELQNG